MKRSIYKAFEYRFSNNSIIITDMIQALATSILSIYTVEKA